MSNNNVGIKVVAFFILFANVNAQGITGRLLNKQFADKSSVELVKKTYNTPVVDSKGFGYDGKVLTGHYTESSFSLFLLESGQAKSQLVWNYITRYHEKRKLPLSELKFVAVDKKNDKLALVFSDDGYTKLVVYRKTKNSSKWKLENEYEIFRENMAAKFIIQGEIVILNDAVYFICEFRLGKIELWRCIDGKAKKEWEKPKSSAVSINGSQKK